MTKKAVSGSHTNLYVGELSKSKHYPNPWSRLKRCYHKIKSIYIYVYKGIIGGCLCGMPQ